MSEARRVEYSARAFQQDAQAAMRGQLERALIELITNSDDAYRGDKGKILVEVHRASGPFTVVTRDRAVGMSAEELERKIGQLGGRTSGFEEGERVRGNLGRGAKDLAAFGKVVFESIKEDTYSVLTLHPSGTCEPDKSRVADKETRERLHIPRGNGTVVTMHVEPRFRCPQHTKLRERLSKHFQLRDILSDPNRSVLLTDGGDRRDVVRHATPDLEVVLETELEIEGYPDARAQLTVHRNGERYDNAPSDPYRPEGLLLTGRRAIYENTLFGVERNPYSGWFSGRVECEYIDYLVDEHDQRLERDQERGLKNPIPIISRTRDGLMHEHPFYEALKAAVDGPLRELVAKEEERSRGSRARESAQMRKSLDSLGRDLGRMLSEDLREIDAEDFVDTTEGEAPPDLKLVPEGDLVVYMGEDKTVGIQVRSDLNVDHVDATVEPDGVVEIAGEKRIQLSPHRNRSDVLTGSVKLRGVLSDANTILTVRAGDKTAMALVEVRPPRETEEVGVETLQFERQNYSVRWGREKVLRILAPADIVAAQGKDVRVISGHEGIVVLDGIVHLELDEEFEHYVGEVRIEGRSLSAHTTIRAQLGEHSASSRVRVANDGDDRKITIKLQDEEAGALRAIVDRSQDGCLIRIMARHPVTKRFLGSAPDFPGQDNADARTLLAEIIAGEITRVFVEEKLSNARDDEMFDAAVVYFEHTRQFKKYLARCSRLLVPSTEVEG